MRARTKNAPVELSYKIIACLLYGGYLICSLFGIVPFVLRSKCKARKQSRTKQARKSNFWFIYGAASMLLTAAALPFIRAALRKYMRQLSENQLVAIVGFNRYTVMHVCTILTVGNTLYRRSEFITLLNKMLKCNETFRRLTATGNVTYWRMIGFLIVRLLALGTGAMWTIFLMINDKSTSDLLHFLLLFFLYFCQCVLQMALDMFYCGILSLVKFTQQHNQLLRNILSDIEDLSGNSNWRHRRIHNLIRQLSSHFQSKGFETLRVQKLNWLNVELLQLLRLHSQIVLMSHKLLSLFGMQLVSFLTFVFSECVFHMFMAYYVAFSSGRHSEEPPTPANESAMPDLVDPTPPPSNGRRFNLVGGVYLLGLWVDMTFLICSINALTLRLRETYRILNKGLVIGELAIVRNSKFVKTLNYYSLYLAKTEISFKAWGLFNLDRQLLLSVAETLLMYLLVLIQFDKVLNK